MPAAIPIAMIASSAIGGALANRGSSSSSGTSSTMPQVAPEFQGLQAQMLDMVKRRLATSTDLSGYTAGGVRDINRTFDLAGQSTANNLTARGLSGSPVAGAADASRNVARAGAIGNFRASIPLVQRDLQGQDLGLAGSLLGFGRGTTSTGNTTGTQSLGGGAAGSFENLASMLGYLSATGQLGRFSAPGSVPSSTIPGTNGGF